MAHNSYEYNSRLILKRGLNFGLLASVFSLLSVSTAVPAFALAGEVLIDRVLAVVDAHPIFYSDIRRKVETGPLVLVSEYPSDKDANNQTRALNDSINFELILSAAKDLDVDVTDADLDQEINRYMEEQKLTKDKLLELLRNEGESFESYKRDFRNQMVLRRFQRRVILPNIKITDKDLETYFLSQSHSGAVDLVEVSMRQIIVKADASMSKDLLEARKALAQDIYGKLKSGLDFAEAVGLYSDDPSSRKGAASLFTIKIKDLASNIRGVIDQLKPGEFSNPISTPNGIQIFQVVERKLGVNKEFQDRRAQLEQELRVVELRNQTNKYLADQRQRVTIKLIEE